MMLIGRYQVALFVLILERSTLQERGWLDVIVGLLRKLCNCIGIFFISRVPAEFTGFLVLPGVIVGCTHICCHIIRI